MGNPIALISLGALFAAFAVYLVYSGSINLWTGVALLGFIASIAGMLKCVGGEASSGGRKAIAAVLFVIALGFMGLFVWQSGVFSKDAGKPKGPDLKLGVFEVARANVFGRKLVEVAPGARALLLTGSTKENEALIKAQKEELKKTFGTSIEIAAEESFPVERIKGIIPRYGLTKATSAKDFEGVITNHKDCNLVISLVGLPREFWKMSIWRWNDMARPKMAFLEGEPRILSGFARKGQVCLFAAYLPGWTYTPDAPADAEKAFALRYVLVGSQGVYQIPTPKLEDPSKPAAAPAQEKR